MNFTKRVRKKRWRLKLATKPRKKMGKPPLAVSKSIFGLLANIWVSLFFYHALTYSSDWPPFRSVYIGFALSGTVLAYLSDRNTFRSLLSEYRAEFGSFAAFGILIIFSETMGFIRMNHQSADPWVTFQAWIAFCAPALAFFLLDRTRLTALVYTLAVICIWHFFAVPFEAITGMKVSWQDTLVYPSSGGVFSYLPSGLAKARYYYCGFFFPVFYIVIGLLDSKQIFPKLKIKYIHVICAAALWLLPTLTTQSRSAFAGAFVGGLVLAARYKTVRKHIFRTFPVVVALTGLIAYFGGIFSNRTPFEVHLNYWAHYLKSAVELPYLWVGHSQHFDRTPMFIPNYALHLHSHNDFIEIFWKWGLPALLSYFVAWAFMVRRFAKDFLPREEFWPLAAMLALLPNLITDLGFMHLEKANFIVLLLSAMIAVSYQRKLKTAYAL